MKARAILAGALLLALAGISQGAPGQTFSLRGDGWYAPAKGAAEVKDYTLDWSQELASDKKTWKAGDDTIATAAWTYGSGITGGPESLNADKTAASTWLAGGTAGQKYAVALTITTAGGRTETLSFKIEVK
jgi:hypothetical protein